MKLSDKKQSIFYITYAIVLFFLLYNFRAILGLGNTFLSMIFPFIVGAGIAFILSLPMGFIERKLDLCIKKERWKRLKRPISLILTLIVFLVVIAVVIVLVIPAIAEAFMKILETIPPFLAMVITELESMNLPVDELKVWVDEATINWSVIGQKAFEIAKSWSAGIFTSTVGVVSSAIGVVADGFISFVFAIYILCAKESLYRQFKMLCYAFLPEKGADEVFRMGRLTHKTFSSFFAGQCLEACILGVMFVVTMVILGIPYAVLIGVLIAVTALIPIFGAFIGCGVGVFLILMVDPMKALIFLILFLVLQQMEGNLIYPKVVGGSIGLPGIWVLVAVSVGASLMGVVGMILFIPMFSVFYALLREKTYKNLKRRSVAKDKIK